METMEQANAAGASKLWKWKFFGTTISSEGTNASIKFEMMCQLVIQLGLNE